MPSAPVLMTGAAGFVGSWLMPLLEERGERVVGVHQPGTPPATFGDEWVHVDLRDRRLGDQRRTQRVCTLGRDHAIGARVHPAQLHPPRQLARQHGPTTSRRCTHHNCAA